MPLSRAARASQTPKLCFGQLAGRNRMTRAACTKSVRKYPLPRLVMRPRMVRSPVDICLGTSPIHAEKSRPLANAAPLPIAATIALEMIGPMPEAIDAAFRRGMADLGYVEGKNYVAERRLNPDSVMQAAADLVRLNVNLIFAAAPAALAAASNAKTSIPIVGIDLESDPIAKGISRVLPVLAAIFTGVFLIFRS